MITTIILSCACLILGMVIGYLTDAHFKNGNKQGYVTANDSEKKEWYLKGFDDGTHNGNYMRGYWKGYDDGWGNCKCGKERKNPLDRVYEDFEKEVNNDCQY